MNERLRGLGFSEDQIEAVMRLWEEFGYDEELNTEVEKLRKEVDDYETRLRESECDKLIENALRAAGAKSVKAAKALIDIDELEFDGKKIIGLDEQIKKLLSDRETAFLFDKGKGTRLKGMKPKSASGKAGEKDFSSFTYADWDNYYKRKRY